MSCKWVKSCSAVQVGIILILPTKVVGLAYFIPISDKDTKRLRYYSQFFNTAEMDSFMKDSIRNMSYNDDSTLNRAFLSLASYLLSSIFDASIVKRSYLK
jgi:hypothetical protein